MITKGQNRFAFVGGGLMFVLAVPLLLAGAAKTNVLLLDLPNKLLPVKEQHMLFLMGAMELTLSAFLLVPKKRPAALLIGAWFASNLLFSQSYMFLYDNSAGCLASLTGKLPVLPKYYDYFSFVVLASLLIEGAVVFVSISWPIIYRVNRTEAASSLGFSPEEKPAHSALS